MIRRSRRWGRSYRLGMAVVTAACLSLWALPGVARASFLPAVDMSDTWDNASGAMVATSPSGTVTVVWARSKGSDWVLQARRIKPDGSLGPILYLTEPLPQLGPFLELAAVDYLGTTTVAWSRWDGGWSGVSQARQIKADGTLGPVLDLSPPDKDALVTTVGAGSTGAVAAWTNFDVSTGSTQVQARRFNADGSLGPVQDISAAGDRNPLAWDVAVDGSGNATVVWESLFAGGLLTDFVRSRRMNADGSLGPIRNLLLDQPKYGDYPQLAVTPSGTATVVWRWRQPVGWPLENWVTQGRRINANGWPGIRWNVSDTDSATIADHARVGVDLFGNATVAWAENDFQHSTTKMQFRRIKANGSLGLIQDLSGDGYKNPDPNAYELLPASPELAVSTNGDAIAAWTRKKVGAANYEIEARRIKRDGSLGPVQYPAWASGPDDFWPAVAADSWGNATVVWQAYDGVRGTVQAAQEVMPPACGNRSVGTPPDTARPISLSCSGLAITHRSIVTEPQHGALGPINQGAGTVTYTPDPGYTGQDSFTFAAENRGGESTPATVRITVK